MWLMVSSHPYSFIASLTILVALVVYHVPLHCRALTNIMSFEYSDSRLFISFVHAIIIIWNKKIVWKHGPYSCLNLKYLGWLYREYVKTAKNGGFCEEFLSENDMLLNLVYSEVAWVLVSSETQVQPQIILDPDYPPDYFSVSYDYDAIIRPFYYLIWV